MRSASVPPPTTREAAKVRHCLFTDEPSHAIISKIKMRSFHLFLLASIATACATDGEGPSSTRPGVVEFDAAAWAGGAVNAGGVAQGGSLPIGGNAPTGGSYATGGLPSTGGVGPLGSGGAGGYGTGGIASGGLGSGGFGTGGLSMGGSSSGGAAGSGSGGTCPIPILCAGGAAGAAGAAGAGGSAGTAGVGGAGFCDNATCFDIFDCYLYFPDKTACKFTKCEGLLCKP